MHRLRCSIALCAAIALVSCAASPSRPAKAPIDNIVKNNAAKHGIPAQAVVVLHNGEAIYRKHYGTASVDGGFPVDEETIFPVYSVSKLFAATLLLQLAEEGKVDLRAPASLYVDDLPLNWNAITVEQFLSHVSGVPEYFDLQGPDQGFPQSMHTAFERISKKSLVDPPATRTRYTNTNFLVIAAILESVTERSYGEIVRDRIIGPLGLRSTWLGLGGVPRGRLVNDYRGENGRIVPDVAIAWPRYSAAHGDLYSTAGDIAVFLNAVAEGRFVSRGALMRLWKPYALSNGSRGFFASGWDYGESGVWRELGHDGGTKVRVRILFQQDLVDHYVIVYLTNGSRDNVWSRTLVDSIQRLILPQ
jgi:D-alanyl-D-alanine carboxypeptidase